MDEVELIIKEAEQIPVVEIRGERGLRKDISPKVAEFAVWVTLALLFTGGAWNTWAH
jgi:hypothetical protein